jgi:hypothetical protein
MNRNLQGRLARLEDDARETSGVRRVISDMPLTQEELGQILATGTGPGGEALSIERKGNAIYLLSPLLTEEEWVAKHCAPA